jgi:hypothetical protein
MHNYEVLNNNKPKAEATSNSLPYKLCMDVFRDYEVIKVKPYDRTH